MKLRARSMSVGRRLSLLVAAEVATAGILLALGVLALRSLSSSSQFMQRFVLVPIQEIGAALDEVGRLGRLPADPARDRMILRHLDTFATHYRTDIQVSGNPSADARRQTDELRKSGHLSLIDDEEHTVASFQHGIERLTGEANDGPISLVEVDDLRLDLRDLLRINLAFVGAAYDDIALSAARTERVLVTVGLLGILVSGALAWRVRGAIAPRISELVRKVRKFTEYGVNERARIEGNDDIAVLGNALDVGFAAIADRNREREWFLAVAAHELKTPMVSILGFLQAALAHPESSGRALQVVRRQTKRLSHLVEDLLWAANVGTSQLAFRPASIDLATVTRHLADEVGETAPDHPFSVAAPSNLFLLADEKLITHALWSLLSYATLLSEPNQAVDVSVEPSGARALVTVKIHGSPLPPQDELRVFEPFSTLQFEGDSRPRSPVGLFLSREIARVHGGSLVVREDPGTGPIFTLNLPA
jgi:signal transduction histidine kinase